MRLASFDQDLASTATTPTSPILPPIPRPETPPHRSRTILSRFYKFFTALSKAIAPFLMIMLYSVMGAWIFVALERDMDVLERREHKRTVHEARAILTDTMDRLCSPKSEMWNRTEGVVNAVRTFEEAVGFQLSEDETIWGFYNAILYAGSIFTTIGYGNIVCKTTPGRIVTIFYAIVGIPLSLSAINQVGDLLLKLLTYTTRIIGRICCSMCARRNRRQSKRNSSIRRERLPSKDKDVELGMMADDEKECASGMKVEHENNPPVMATLVSTIGWLFFCAAFFCIWEDWDYFTSFYFFFVSMSTIGFGDIVPDHPQYMIMNVGLVFIGLSLVSVTINVVQKKLEDMYMSLLAKLLNEYMQRMSEGEDGVGANVGLINSWGMNKKAKFLMPFLSKGKRKLVMQRFQEEAKAQGFELPSTLTDLDPGTGLPNILNIEKTNDPGQQMDAVQQLIEKKEHQQQQQQGLLLMRQASIAPALISPSPPARSTPVQNIAQPVITSHASCQTGEADKTETEQQTETLGQQQQSLVASPLRTFQLREASSQTDVNGTSGSTPKRERVGRVVREIQTRSSLSLLKDSGSQTLAKTTSNRLSQTFGSSWRLQDSSSQTLVNPTPRKCIESQTNLVEMIETGQQYGAELGSLSSIGSQTFLERDNVYVQTHSSSFYGLRESGSQTIYDRSESSNQTGLSFFALRESESQTISEQMMDSAAQTRPNETSSSSAQTRQSFFALRESQSQTLFETQDTPVQTRQSLFDVRHAQAQTQGPSSSVGASQTAMSIFGMRAGSSQTICDLTDEALQTVLEVDEMGSQIGPETTESRMQAGQSFFELRSTESQTRLDMSERDTQTWATSIRTSDALVEAKVGVAQTGSQTVGRQNRERHVQTGPSVFDTLDRSIQTTMMPRSQSPLHTVGVQTGVLSRVPNFSSRSSGASGESTPSTSSTASTPAMAPLFRQMSLQKMPAPFKRQATAHALGASLPQMRDERVPLTRALRHVQQSRLELPDVRRQSITVGDSPLPSVRALASQFERRTIPSSPLVAGASIAQQAPGVRRATLPRRARAPFEQSSGEGSEEKSSDDQGASQEQRKRLE